MQKRTKSILEELNNFHREKYSHMDAQYMLESRIHNVISVINRLFETVDKLYSKDDSIIVKRKFLNAVKDQNSEKLIKSMRKIINANKKSD